MSNLWDLSLCAAADQLHRREISAAELVRATLARIEKLEPALHAFAAVTPDVALRQAEAADAALGSGEATSRLLGIPVAYKDIYATRDAPTAAGSVVLAGWNPGVDAGAALRLRQAGAVTVGKLTTTEAACGAHHPSITPPRNPWNADYWTGASSSGSGAATAAGLCFASLGSDTGGSIRFPAHCCGLVGLKPTWGRVSRYGVFPLAETLDHAGPLTRTVEDAAVALRAIAGRDPRDPTTLHAAVPDYPAMVREGVRDLRVGFDAAYCSEGVADLTARALAEAAEVFASRGARVVSVEVPRRSESIEAWLVLCAVEAVAAHAAYYPERAAEYGPALTALLEFGRGLSAPDYARAQLERLRVVREWERLFADVDLIVSPTTYDLTPPLSEARRQMRGDGMRRLVAFTAAANLTGLPTLSLPAGTDAAGVPFGFQLIGQPLGEATLCRAGWVYEQDGPWRARRPPL